MNSPIRGAHARLSALALLGALMATPWSGGVASAKTPRPPTNPFLWSQTCGLGLPQGVVEQGPSDRSLPRRYSDYAQIVRTIGPVLTKHSRVPVWLPRTTGPSVPASLHYFDVEYGTGAGYCLSLNTGAAMPANSPAERFGYASFIGTIQGLPASLSVNYRLNLPLGPTASWGAPRRVRLTPVLMAWEWGNATRGEWIRWYEGPWSFNVYVAPGTTNAVAEARRDSQRVGPLPHHGGVAAFSAMISEAVMVWHGVRYLVRTGNARETMGLARQLVRIPASRPVSSSLAPSRQA